MFLGVLFSDSFQTVLVFGANPFVFEVFIVKRCSDSFQTVLRWLIVFAFSEGGFS